MEIEIFVELDVLYNLPKEFPLTFRSFVRTFIENNLFGGF
jgi:hypothetical protein